MLAVGFEPTILGGEGSQTYALDRAATGTCENKHTGEHSAPQAHKCKYTRINMGGYSLGSCGNRQHQLPKNGVMVVSKYVCILSWVWGWGFGP